MSAIDPDKKEIVAELVRRRSSLTPDKQAIVDELASRFGISRPDNSAILAQQAAKYPTAAEQGGKAGAVATPLDYQGILGRLAQIGHATNVAANEPVPISTGQESTGNAALDIAHGVLAGGIPGAPELAGAGLLEQFKNSPAAKAVTAIKDAIAERLPTPQKIFNQVANVPSGRKGVETLASTGEIKTNPGNAPVRVLEAEGKSKLAQAKDALLARPTPQLQVKIYGELQNAGTSLSGQLAKSPAVFDVAPDLPLDNPKIVSAMQEAGIQVGQRAVAGRPLGNGINASPFTVPAVDVNAEQAHALRSAIGDRINWNPKVVNDTNDALKDAWMALGDKINASVDGIAPFNKRWQEAYLYNQALKSQLDKVAAGRIRPLSAAQKAALATGGIAATGVGVYEALK